MIDRVIIDHLLKCNTYCNFIYRVTVVQSLHKTRKKIFTLFEHFLLEDKGRHIPVIPGVSSVSEVLFVLQNSMFKI